MAQVRQTHAEQINEIDRLLDKLLARALSKSKSSIRREGTAKLRTTTVERIRRLDYVNGAKAHVEKSIHKKNKKLIAILSFRGDEAVLIVRPPSEKERRKKVRALTT